MDSIQKMVLSKKSLVVAYTQALADHRAVSTWVKAEDCSGLPKHLNGSIRLNIGLNMPIPVPDLCVDESGISCTLSFSRTPHYVVIPWSAVEGFMDSEEADRQIAENAKKKRESSVSSEKKHNKIIAQQDNVVRVKFEK